EPSRRAVPDRECEHAVEPIQEVQSPRIVGMGRNFAVRPRSETASQGLQLSRELAVVVDLTVDDSHGCLALSAKRLAAAGYVDDRQATVSEDDTRPREHAFVVRATVPDACKH